MFRVALKLVLAAAALAAVWCFVPVKGRTLAERWGRARTATEFVGRAWSDLAGRSGAPGAPVARPPKPPGRGPAQARGAPAPRPTESHSESDRKALDRVLSEHLGE